MKVLERKFIHIFVIIALVMSTGTAIAGEDKLNDKEISQAVESELLFNATTPAYLIDVATAEGIVTLSGSVNNILARDRAIQIAKTVKGVRGVIDKIDVNVPDRSDAALEKEVNEALLRDPATESYEANVEVSNGSVVLTGEVDSWQEKQLSTFVAKGVRGVKDVKNNMNVVYRIERTDYEIKTDVEKMLANDLRVDDALIEVNVDDGIVELSGTVGSANEKTIASALAWTAGVEDVSADELVVSEWTRNDNFRENKYKEKSDEEVEKAVVDALLYDPRVYSFNPSVSVQSGVVTLSGTVNNVKAKRAAEQDAKNVVGVYRVNNFLKVRPDFIPEDADLESQVQTALLKDPIVEKWEVDVTAKNGVVYLNGEVDSYFEKVQAEDIASKTKGVIAIQNNLAVNDKNDFVYYDYYGWNTYYPPYHVDVKDFYRSDREIKANIESQLWWSPYVNESEVNVEVDNGTAVLTGTVDTPRERVYAEINALEGGAYKVVNDLNIEEND